MKIKNGFVKRKIGDSHLVVTTGELSKSNSMFIEMNETSSDIWELIEKGFNEDQIAKKIADIYSISVEKAAADVKKLISAMTDAGIFEEE